MKIAQRCPVCLGSGNVPGGFYNVCAGQMTSWSSSYCSFYELCRSCVDGLVYVEQEVDECKHVMVDNRMVTGQKICLNCGHTE
jgi:hypothetical protein